MTVVGPLLAGTELTEATIVHASAALIGLPSRVLGPALVAMFYSCSPSPLFSPSNELEAFTIGSLYEATSHNLERNKRLLSAGIQPDERLNAKCSCRLSKVASNPKVTGIRFGT